MDYTTIGKHATVDFWGVSFDLLNDKEWLQVELQKALSLNQVKILSCQSKQFKPYGVTVLVMLAESHASIHTYPEKGFAALDCYTCGHHIDPTVIVEYLVERLRPKRVYAKLFKRGDGPIESIPMKEKVDNYDA